MGRRSSLIGKPSVSNALRDECGGEPLRATHRPLSIGGCRELTAAAGRELLMVSDHMIYSRTPDGRVFQQWRPDPRFPPSDAWPTGAIYHGRPRVEDEQA